MSSRTANWVQRTNPGVVPPSPSVRGVSVAPTIYPESSISNPDSSRYRRGRASSMSHGPPHSGGGGRSYYTSSQHSRSASQYQQGSYYGSGSVSVSSPRDTPFIATTGRPGHSPSSYVIIPPAGEEVKIIVSVESFRSGFGFPFCCCSVRRLEYWHGVDAG